MIPLKKKILSAMLILSSISSQAQYPDYTDADVRSALTAFNDHYYSRSKKLYYEKSTKTDKVAAIWTQAIFLDMMQNAWLRSGSRQDSLMFQDILEGNRLQYDNYNWDNGKVWFIYDDIMWWVISLARTYLITGDTRWLDLSESGFERVWSGSKVLKDKGSYDPVRGGMYWAWDQKHPEGSPAPTMGKMACINYPTVIAAMTLFDATGDSAWFHKGLEIYNWAQNNLFDRENGRVADSKHGSPAWKDHVYNQATCMGAATMLYKATGNRRFLNEAILAADYTKDRMSRNGFLHFETGTEQGIYIAIFAQYIIRLIEDGKQEQYLPWLRRNINAGWANRIPSSGVTCKDFARPAPDISLIESYDASAVPALMQVIPPLGKKRK
ncbi:MAG: glycoside hydrolase family 76 protein [Bacteroidales bacterium]|nr:glycoside hydrolase family 76 protein [Bacteroidales bacterium]